MDILLPWVFYPLQSTASHIKKDPVDEGVLQVGNASENVKPRDKSESRLRVLNALRTLVPACGLFRAGGEDIPLILYDFYYENSTLRLIIVQPGQMQAYDAFAFQQDVMHVLNRESKPGFQFFYLLDDRTRRYNALDDVLPGSVKSHKLNASLLNWMTKLQGRTSPAPPSWKPLSTSIARYLYSSPKLSKILAEPCRGPWHEVITTSSSAQLVAFASPFIQDCRHFYEQETRNTTAAYADQKTEVAVPEKDTQTAIKNEKAEKKKKAPLNTSLFNSVRFQCALGERCTEPPTHAWTCCGNLPRVCSRHAEEYRLPSCPFHGVLSEMTCLGNA